MSLQNRVNPFGEIVATAARGTFMGNRGVLHNDERVVVRQAQLRRWITCRTQFRNRSRAVMAPRRYTELFFLDEATSFSAGHRPCAECRNAEYQQFRSLWQQCFGGTVRADIIDVQLQHERLAGRSKRMYRQNVARLPDGTFIALDNAAWLVWHGRLFQYTYFGYTESRILPASCEVDVLTPESCVHIMRAGYLPNIHPTVTR